MIHIEEKFLDENTVAIKLGGVLNQSTIPVIKGVYDRYRENHHIIYLDLKGLIHITREGRDFLNKIKQQVRLTHIPGFMQLENSP